MGKCPLSVPITWAWHQWPLAACRGEVTAEFVLSPSGLPQKNTFYFDLDFFFLNFDFYFDFPSSAAFSSVLLTQLRANPFISEPVLSAGPRAEQIPAHLGSSSSTELTLGPNFSLLGDAQ